MVMDPAGIHSVTKYSVTSSLAIVPKSQHKLKGAFRVCCQDFFFFFCSEWGVNLCAWHWAGAWWETGAPLFCGVPSSPQEPRTFRSFDKCFWSFSFLLPSWKWQGNSHATAQYLNKRVCLIQLSPQDCAKWVSALFDRDNEQARRRRRGCWVARGWRWSPGLIQTFTLHSFYTLPCTLTFPDDLAHLVLNGICCIPAPNHPDGDRI